MPPPIDPDPPDALPDAVEELMIECLGVAEAEQSGHLEAACARHPEHATALRRRFVHLREMGLGGVPVGETQEPVPERLGEFRLLERLGAGGMGVVFRALQESLQREVAIKLIRPERLYFPGSKAMFRREVQAVARMHHPGIVPIHLVGEQNGIPFYAMELVRGRSLAVALLDCRALPASEFGGGKLLPGSAKGWVDACCEVARQVALALAHAHARGVVHRDVKPSNVMVGEDGRALLVDFGLASHGGGQRLTRTGSQPGSLAYMSPEQVRGERVDERTDVYSLGVTLYEMLTLQPAFAGDTEAALRARIERGEVAPMTLARRGIPWDVATVCATAMAPECAQRYATAAELAADLQACLDRKPIAARRPGLGLRVRRLAQRRPALATGILLGTLLVVGAPTALLVQEHGARAAIEEEAEIARQVTEFLVDLFGNADPHISLGEDVRVRTLVDIARERLRSGPVPRPRVRVELLETLGKVYAGIGRTADAQALLTEARELRVGALRQAGAPAADVSGWLGVLARQRGDLETSEQELTSALDQLRRADPPDPDVLVRVMTDLGETLAQRGRSDAAERLLTEALELARSSHPGDSQAVVSVLHHLGRCLLDAQGPAVAEPSLREAVAMYDRGQPEDHIGKVLPLTTYGYCLFQLGRRDDAEPVLRRAQELASRFYGPEHPMTASVREQQAVILNDLHQYDAAEAMLREVIATYHATLHPPDQRLGRAERNLAVVLGGQGRLLDAAAGFERALEQYQKLGEAGRAGQLDALYHLGFALLAAGRTAAATERLRAAVELGEQLPAPDPGILAQARSKLARAEAAAGRIAAAATLAARAVAGLRAAKRTMPVELGVALIDHGQVLILAEDAHAALPIAEAAVAVLEPLGARGEGKLVEALCLRSLARERTGAVDAATQDADAALVLARRRFDAKSTLLVFPLRHKAHLEGVGGRHAQALELCREVMGIVRRATGGAGEVYASNLTAFAKACLDAGDPAGATKHARECLRLLEEAQVRGGPAATALVEFLVRLLEQPGTGIEPERVRAAAERWLPQGHALRVRIQQRSEPAASRRG